MSPCPEFHFTPAEIAAVLMKDITFVETDYTLEPCRALGSFYNLIPYNKEWCEIDEGRDFFTYEFGDTKFSKVITNPPYRTNHTDATERKNICVEFIFRCLEVCDGEVWLLLNGKMFNTLTPKRLGKMREMGFNMTFMRILDVKIWYGRYYWVCFSTKGASIIHF